MALSLRIVTLIGVLLSVHALSSCNGREVEQQEEQTLELPPIENQLTGEQIDSLNEARREALIQKYNAISLKNNRYKLTYQFQDFLDTSALFVLDGRVDDIIRQDGQLILIHETYSIRLPVTECVMLRISIPVDLFSSRAGDLQDSKGLRGYFIVDVKNSFYTRIRTPEAKVTDYRITESGELDYANTEIYHHDEQTLIVYGELVDFSFEKKK